MTCTIASLNGEIKNNIYVIVYVKRSEENGVELPENGGGVGWGGVGGRGVGGGFSRYTKSIAMPLPLRKKRTCETKYTREHM